jgi:hypothetical protein
VNYYNMVGYKNYRIRGRVVERNTGRPIEGAVVRGWNEWWNVGQNTFTHTDGYFELYSNDENIHFEISARGYNRAKFENRDLQYVPTSIQATPRADLPRRDLEYAHIHYRWFLRNPVPDTIRTPHFLFDFAPEHFDTAQYETQLPVVQLQRL